MQLKRALLLVALCLFGSASAQPAPARAVLEAAQKGDAPAQFKLGEMYDLGQGVPQDYAQAVKWYRAAAEQGLAAAQFALAEMLKNGDGVAKNLAEAVRWYRRAADQNHAGAQLLLGVLAESGTGMPHNAAQAAQWYRLSAEQGDARALLLLANLYQTGQGVPKSAVASWALYTRSLAVDGSRANPSAEHRAQLSRSMTAQQVQAATRLAEDLARAGNFAKALDSAVAGATAP
ncbi:MAG: tetratricopeptide repeat protein [Betaproteobacteria bacterium]